MNIKDKIQRIKYSRMTPKEIMRYFIVDGVETNKEGGRIYYKRNSINYKRNNINIFYFRKFAFTDDPKYGEIVFSHNLFYRLRKKLHLDTNETELLIMKTIALHFKIRMTFFTIEYL